MDDLELTGLLLNLESDRAERKESPGDIDDLRKCICAFANDLPNHRLPGVIFIGAKDNGACANLKISDDLLLALSELRSDGKTLPFPHITVQTRTINQCPLAVIIVNPSDSTPIRFSGRVWVRVGPSCRQASPEEERRLSEKRRARDLPFDLRPFPSATLEDLDLELFRRTYLPLAIAPEILEANNRTVEEQMVSLRFLTFERIPTVAGILTFGKDVRRFLPGAYVQFLRIEGSELTDSIKDQKEINGPLPELLWRLEEILKAHISVATDITSQTLEVRHPDYPIVALQQIARNAVLHRAYEGTQAPVRLYWYSDRIEIQNPGGPFGQVTPENFGEPGLADYRNQQLAEVMRTLGYIQRFGVGLQIAMAELAKNGNPPPQFEARDNRVQVTIRRRP